VPPDRERFGMDLDTTHFAAYAAGIIAGLLVCVSFFMKTIIPLRIVAIASNLGFIFFGIMLRQWPCCCCIARYCPSTSGAPSRWCDSRAA